MTTELPPDRLGQSVSDVRLAGHLFQIQNVTGNVTVNVGPIVRSAYLEQVKRIAPPELYDRGDELLELTEFCTDVDRPPYTWWRAEAWSGKSALMSWFVLHPPSDVQIISFFITARYADQNDRVAFIDVVLEQLAELLRQPMPAYLTEATREAHFMNLPEQADALVLPGRPAGLTRVT